MTATNTNKITIFVVMEMRCRIRVLLCTIVLGAVLTTCHRSGRISVKTEIVSLDSLAQIEPLITTLVKPKLYTNISGLEKLPRHKAKKTFIAAILPSILVAKHEMEQRRRAVVALSGKAEWSASDSLYYRDLKRRYQAKDINDLLARVGTLPSSIVLAQAAVESGWGTSRFFLKANNLFGIWSFDSTESRIPARQTRDKKRIYLRAYPDIAQSIVDYFEILARSRSYKSLRAARLQTADAYALLPHLRNYSERRNRYTRQLKSIIAKNDLTAFDQYQLDPAYLIED